MAFHGSTGHLSFEAACLAVSFATCPIDGPVGFIGLADLRKLQELQKVGKPPNISGIFIGFYMNLRFEFALSELYSSGQNPSGSEAEGGRFEGMAGGTKISRSVDFEDFPGGFPGRIGRFPMDFPVMFDCLNCHWLLDSQLLDFPLVIKLSNNSGTFTVRHGNLAMTMDEHR